MKPILRKVLTSKYLILSVSAILLYTLGGFFAAPRIIRWYTPKYVQQNLHCRLGIDKVRVNPFLLTLEIDGFSLHQADGLPLAAFERLFVDLETSSLFRWAIVLRELQLENPDIHMVIAPDGSINFNALAQSPKQTPEEPATSEASPLPFILQNAAIVNGRIVVVDKRPSTPADFTIQGLDLHLHDFATVKEHYGTYHLAAATEDGESVQGDGEISLAPFHSKGKLAFNAIRIASLWEFVRDSTNLQQPEGKINLATAYHVNADNSPVQATLEELRFSLADLTLRLPATDSPCFQLKKMTLAAPRFDLGSQELRVEHLLFEDGDMDVRINDSGVINLQGMILGAAPERHPAPVPAAQSAPEPPWAIQADAIEVKNMAIHVEDESRKNPLKAEIAGGDLHLRAKLTLGVDTGSIVLDEMASELRGVTIHGTAAPEPLFTTDKLTVAGGRCDLNAQTLTFARIAMQQGRLDAARDGNGKINWQELLQAKSTANQSEKPEPAADDAGPAWSYLVSSFEVDGFDVKFSDLTTGSDKPVLSLQGFNAKTGDIDGKSPMDFTVRFQAEQGGTATVNGTVNPATASIEADLQVDKIVLTSLQPYLDPHVTLQIQSAAASAHGRLRYGIPEDKQQAAYEGSFSLSNLRLINPGVKKPYLSWDDVRLSKCRLTLQPNRLDAQEISISKPVGELIIEKDKTLNLAKVLKNRPDGQKAKTSTKPAPKGKQGSGNEDDFAYHVSKIQVKNGDLVFADFSLRPSFKTRIHDLKGTVTGLSSEPTAQAKIKMDGHVDTYGTAKISGVIRPHDFGRASNINLVFRNVEMKNLSPYSGKFAGRLIESGKLSADLQYTLQEHKMIGENKIIIDNLFLGEQVDNPDASNLPLNLALALLKDGNGRIDIGLPVTGDLNDPQFRIGPLIWKMFTNLIIKTATAPFQALGGLLGGNTESFDAVQFDPGDDVLPPPEKEKLLKLADALKNRPELNVVIQGRYSPERDGLELKERAIRRTVGSRIGAKPSPDDNPEPLDFSDSKTQDALEKLYKERLGKASLDELEKGLETGAIKPRVNAQDRKGKKKEAGMFAKITDSIQLYKLIPGGKSYDQAVVWAEELYAQLVDNEKMADEVFLKLAERRAQAIATNLEEEGQIPKNRISMKNPEPLSEDKPPAATLSLDAR